MALTGRHFPFVNALRCEEGCWGAWGGRVQPLLGGFSCTLKGQHRHQGPSAGTALHQNSPGIPRLLTREITRPAGTSSGISAKTLTQSARKQHFREKTRPARQKTPILGCFERTGRTFSRTRRHNMTTLKPTTPLRTPNKGSLKPASPLHPKTAPKTPISRPQRRWRFQSRTGTSEQRRQGFQRATWSTGPGRRPVGGRRYKRRQTNAIQIAARGLVLQTSSI